MNRRKNTLSLVIFFAVIALLTGIPVGETVAGDAADHMMNTSEDGENGLNASEVFILWGHDPDGNLSAYGIDTSSNESALRDFQNLSSTQEFAMMTDIPLNRPVSIAETWSKNDFQDWHPGDSGFSRYPAHATLQNSTKGYIRDAHATLFGHHPSTHAFINGSSPRRYISPNGTVRGAIDYRIHEPSDIPGNSTRVERQIENHSVESVCLLETNNKPTRLGDSPCDGRSVLAQENNTRTPELDYESIAYSQTMNYTLVASINATVNLTIQENTTVEKCERVITSVGFREECEDVSEWQTTEVQIQYDSVTVSDTWEGTVYKIRATKAKATLTQDNEMQIYALGDLPINGYNLINSSVQSPWTFYTARNKAWDTMKQSNGYATYTTHSKAHPVQILAYHSGGSYNAISDSPNSTSQAEVIKEVNSQGNKTIDPAAKPENLAATVALNYSLASSVISSIPVNDSMLQGENVENTNITVRPLVQGSGTKAADITDSSTYTKVREANLSLKVLNTTNQQVKVKVTLTDNTTGAPIDTSSREGGYVSLSGKNFNTNSSGEAVVVISRATRGFATYHSGKWWEIGQRQPYTNAHARVQVTNSLLSPMNLIRALTQLFVLFFPLLLIAYGLDGYWGLDTWPPWN